MESRAVLKQIGMPATKVRQVVDLVRGKPVEEALSIQRRTGDQDSVAVRPAWRVPSPTWAICME